MKQTRKGAPGRAAALSEQSRPPPDTGERSLREAGNGLLAVRLRHLQALRRFGGENGASAQPTCDDSGGGADEEDDRGDDVRRNDGGEPGGAQALPSVLLGDAAVGVVETVPAAVKRGGRGERS